MKIAPANHFSFFPASGRPGDDQQLKASQEQQLHITIQTREGDVVTISGADFRSLAVAAGPQGMSTEAATAGLRSLSIQGDLNEEELTDLRKLINDLGSIASHFFASRFDQAVARAASLGEMGASLTSLEASFSRSLTYSRVVTFHPVPASFAEAAGELGKAGIPPGRSAAGPQDLLVGRWQQIRSLLSELAPSMPASRPPYQSPIKAARQLFERAMADLPSHPKNAPLLPGMGSGAIRQTAAFFPPAAQTAATRLQHELGDLFRNWLITS